MAGFLRRFTVPAEDPRRAFPDPVERLDDVQSALGRLQDARERLAAVAFELRARCAELDTRARQALAAGDRDGAREMVSLHELAAAELEAVTARLDELRAATLHLSLDKERLAARASVAESLAQLGDDLGDGSVDPFAVELRLASLEWELEHAGGPSRQPPTGG
jgi:hypothetical protein